MLCFCRNLIWTFSWACWMNTFCRRNVFLFRYVPVWWNIKKSLTMKRRSKQDSCGFGFGEKKQLRRKYFLASAFYFLFHFESSKDYQHALQQNEQWIEKQNGSWIPLKTSSNRREWSSPESIVFRTCYHILCFLVSSRMKRFHRAEISKNFKSFKMTI